MLSLNQLSEQISHNSASRGPVLVHIKMFLGLCDRRCRSDSHMKWASEMQVILVESDDGFCIDRRQRLFRDVVVEFGIVVASRFES